MSIEVWAWALVLLAIADWGATVSLIRAARQVREPALRERAIISIILSLAASGAAGLSLAFLAHFKLPEGLGTAILITVLLAISLPQLIWYAAFRRGHFR